MAINQNDEKKFDLRIKDYSLSKSLITQKEYEKYLADLPDDEENAEYIDLEEEGIPIEAEEETETTTEEFEEPSYEEQI